VGQFFDRCYLSGKIGPDHWQDKAGNATPLTFTDPVLNTTVTFTDLTQNQPETLQAHLIMPEPCEFISTDLPACAIIRPASGAG
jgi:hypothetical protein